MNCGLFQYGGVLLCPIETRHYSYLVNFSWQDNHHWILNTLLCDSKVSFSNASNRSISCVSVWIFAFFTGLNVQCVHYFHGVLF
jgi:hypothetical protein